MSDFDIVIRGGTIADGTGGPLMDGDIAITGDRIVAMGKVSGRGAEEIDARHKIVTPGFVDIHTHYDGQAIWSQELSPSSSHGVTSVVAGNCGVGFAPCRPEDHDLLINLMEGVEDIPELVMSKGLPWNWETYPEYLNALDAIPHDIDIASYLPHSPLRVYAMGERGVNREPANDADIARMQALTREAITAGAIGFATSRIGVHKTASGDQIPTFEADIAELKAICSAMQQSGGGTFQVVLDAFRGWDIESAVLEDIVAETGVRASFALAALNDGETFWRTAITMMERANGRGAQISGQVMPRPVGMITSLELSVHPFILCPSWQKIAHLSVEEQVRAMRDPELRRALTTEEFGEGHPFNAFGRNWGWMFPFSDPPNYDPGPEQSIEAQAIARGCTPQEVAYDRILETEGKGYFLVALGNYQNCKLDAAREMIGHPACVPSLGDGGAHYGAICDASYTTFMLTHWVRDTKTDRIELAEAVHMLGAKTARAVGLQDRGLLRVGGKADVNVIDLDGLKLHLPHIDHDLPAGGRRLNQNATGYEATLVSGKIIRRHDKATGARPGRVIRGTGAA